MDIYQHYRNENEYSDFDFEKAVNHMQYIIQCRTVSHIDTSLTDYGEFDRLQKFIQASYPAIMTGSSWQLVGRSVLIRIPGWDDSLLPAMFIAHQDVVPVIAGTLDKWKHDPFGGEIADGYIWGRGMLDIKEMLAGFLESAEYLLHKGKRFRRTVYLAFGEDEETRNSGSKVIGRYLQDQGVRLEFVWDESGKVRDGDSYGAPEITVGEIGMYEKGYADIYLKTASRGGHSSVPFDGTSLGRLAQGISAVIDNPLPAHLSDILKDGLKALAPYITAEPMKTYVADLEKYHDEIIQYCLANRDLFPQVTTTIAPTQITEGAPAGNVMPNDMRAVINFRLIPEDTVDSLLEHYRQILDPEVEIGVVQAINASRVSNHDSYGFHSLVSALNHYYPEIHFIPSVNTASTDAHNYECICDCCMRFTPFLEDNELKTEGIHGINERLSLRAFRQGIRVMIRMMEETCL